MRIFLFRGLAGAVFSTGMDDLAGKLTAAGHVASVHSWLNRRTVQQELIEELKKGSHSEGVVAIGHSLGGNSANYLAVNLSKNKTPLAYVATIDATEPRQNPSETPADNFRSRDIRAEKVEGAEDYYFPEFHHTQIDKAAEVHNKILARVSSALSMKFSPSRTDGSSSEVSKSSEEEDNLLELLLGKLANENGTVSDDQLVQLISMIIADENLDLVNPDAKENAQPIRDALGKNVGKTLDGRKTGFGIIGLLATTVLPIIFPPLAPAKAVLDSVAIGSTGLATWGILGKIEKWVKLLKK